MGNKTGNLSRMSCARAGVAPALCLRVPKPSAAQEWPRLLPIHARLLFPEQLFEPLGNWPCDFLCESREWRQLSKYSLNHCFPGHSPTLP